MSNRPRTLPTFEGDTKAYLTLLKRESRIKPASTTNRNDIIKRTHSANFINEYDRISGEIANYARVFGHLHTVEKLKKRQEELKKLFHDSNHEPRHEIWKIKYLVNNI